ncbi:DUF1461 domain-containing protein [Candidatus Woesearchaeota archaeon]|nr:DUF1461 domain-containing protein [Candidatus Woesearchaeota archaeon]
MTSKKLAIAVMAVLLVQAIFLSSFRALVFNAGYYQSKFSDVGTYCRVQDADSVLDDILSYLKGDKPALQAAYFNQRESSHMSDVKKFIGIAVNYLYLLAAALALLAALVLRDRKNRRRILLNSLAISSLAVIIISSAMFIASNSFPLLFEKFHLSFFKPGTYLFPDSNMLIRLFPERFFYEFTYDILINSAVAAGIMLILSLFFLRRTKGMEKKKKRQV